MPRSISAAEAGSRAAEQAVMTRVDGYAQEIPRGAAVAKPESGIAPVEAASDPELLAERLPICQNRTDHRSRRK